MNLNLTCAQLQYTIRRLIVRSRKVSKPHDLYLELADRSKIWQAVPLKFECDNSNYQSRSLKTSQDLKIRRLSDIETGPWSPACMTKIVRNNPPCRSFDSPKKTRSNLTQQVETVGTRAGNRHGKVVIRQRCWIESGWIVITFNDNIYIKLVVVGHPYPIQYESTYPSMTATNNVRGCCKWLCRTGHLMFPRIFVFNISIIG